MSDEPAAGGDDATVVMSKSALGGDTPAATVINPAGSGVNIPVHSSGGLSMSGSQRAIAAALPASEKPRSIALALASGALTGLALFAVTVLWLSRGH